MSMKAEITNMLSSLNVPSALSTGKPLGVHLQDLPGVRVAANAGMLGNMQAPKQNPFETGRGFVVSGNDDHLNLGASQATGQAGGGMGANGAGGPSSAMTQGASAPMQQTQATPVGMEMDHPALDALRKNQSPMLGLNAGGGMPQANQTPQHILDMFK